MPSGGVLPTGRWCAPQEICDLLSSGPNTPHPFCSSLCWRPSRPASPSFRSRPGRSTAPRPARSGWAERSTPPSPSTSCRTPATPSRAPGRPSPPVGMVREVYRGRVCFHEGTIALAPGFNLHHVGGHTAGLQVGLDRDQDAHLGRDLNHASGRPRPPTRPSRRRPLRPLPGGRQPPAMAATVPRRMRAHGGSPCRTGRCGRGIAVWNVPKAKCMFSGSPRR